MQRTTDNSVSHGIIEHPGDVTKPKKAIMKLNDMGVALTDQPWETIGLLPGPEIEASSDMDTMVDQVTAVLENRLAEILTARHQHSFPEGGHASDDPAVSSPPVVVPPDNYARCYAELREYVRRIGSNYRDCRYHRFEHAVHVTISANKLLNMLEESERSHQIEDRNEDETTPDTGLEHDQNNRSRSRRYITFGIANDPFAKFCLVYAALIHDVDHQGVPNAQLSREKDKLAVLYNDTSVAEQHSLKVAFSTLMLPEFAELRRALLPTSNDQFTFRMRVIDLVMCTDIASPERMQQSRAKWSEAFKEGFSNQRKAVRMDDTTVSTVTASLPQLVRLRRSSVCALPLTKFRSADRRGSTVGSNPDAVSAMPLNQSQTDELESLRAAAILETMMNAADVAHTLQSYENFLRWNRCLYEELHEAYVSGRTETGGKGTKDDPANGWFKNQLFFYDIYILPLARKLRNCGAFGQNSGRQFVINAKTVRKRWEKEGNAFTEAMIESVKQDYESRRTSIEKEGSTTRRNSNDTSQSSNAYPSRQNSLPDSKNAGSSTTGVTQKPRPLRRRSMSMNSIDSNACKMYEGDNGESVKDAQSVKSMPTDSAADEKKEAVVKPMVINCDDTSLQPISWRYLPSILREIYACAPWSEDQNEDSSSITTTAEVRDRSGADLELRLRLRRPRTLPAHRDLRGTVLILDLSGFTALGERLKSELGDSEGAAEFAFRVNTILSTMVERVYQFGGDVLMFAGDALICLFDEDKEGSVSEVDDGDGLTNGDIIANEKRLEQSTLSRVKECCLRVLGEVASSDGAGGDFTIHGGAAHGLVRCLFLGRPSSAPGDCAFIVSGVPLLQAGKLLNMAGEGEILIDGQNGPITEEEGMRVFSKSDNTGLDNEYENTVLSPTTEGYNVHSHARAYLGTLAARRSDHAENAMSILLNELRPVAIVFVGLHDLNNIARDTTLLKLMNDAFMSLSRITYACNGAVRDMLCDDKGCVFISVFGAHSHEVNPCFDATVCAMRMKDALDELEFERFSLGVSFGECFCGEVGPSIRADYVVMGTEVNMAARLMGKAPNRGILASKRVYTNSKKFILFRQSEHLKVKGKDGFFHAYIPEARAAAPRSSIIEDGSSPDSPEQPFILLPSREYEMTKMLRALHEAEVGVPKVLMLCGGPFLGKSRMISSLSENATNAGFDILQSFRTSLDSFTSYFPFRQITLTALLKCASMLLGRQTDDEVAAIEMLIESKILNKTDRVVLGSILPTVADSQLLSLLRGQNPTALTRSISETLMKLFIPLQPAMVVFEGDGDPDPSSWSLISEMLRRAVEECPRLLLVISSRNALTIPSAVSHLQAEAEYAKLTPLDKYETEIYLEVVLGIHDKGIGVDQKLLDAVHDRANGCPSFIEYIVSWALGKKMIEYDESKNVMSFNLPVTQSEDVAAAIPKELSSIVLASFNDLPAKLWDILKIASCIGYSFDENAYEALDENLGFMPKVKELAATHDVFERSDGHRYKWKHQAVYEAVKSLLIGNQRAQIHSMIVEVFERHHQNGHFSDMVKGDVHRLFAWHCTLAGKWDVAYNQYMEAGKRAEETYNFPEAAKMYEEAISSQKKIVPLPLLRSRLLPTVKLGNCMRELARYKDAEEVLKTCLEEAEKAMDKTDADEQMYVHALTALAALNQAQSKYNEARKLYEKALPIARNLQESRTSLWLAVHIAGYAETLRKSGDLPSAETLHWEALHIRSCSANEGACTSLELAISYTQLGCTLFGQKKYEEAYKQHRMALKTRFELLDFSHGLVSESLNYCAEALCALGLGADGIPLAIHAVNIRKVVFGTSHPAYAHALSILASCYHAVGRSCDARDYFEECLSICEAVFHKNHANIIPNLMNYGKVLCSTGDYEKAKRVFQRAIVIHKENFKEGQRASELETCRSQVEELTRKIDSNAKTSPCTFPVCQRNGGLNHMPIPTVDIKANGTPIIVLTDIGRDVDDEYALVLLAALSRMHLLDPIAVVATLSPQRERAHLARGVLDILGLPNVPVGIGSCGGSKGKVGLDVYGADYSRSCSCIDECGVKLMLRALNAAPDKSVQLFAIGSLTDAATLLRDYEEVFVTKVKEVLVMGGLEKIEEGKFVVPDTAYNNNCDAASAEYFYHKCQELCIPTITLSRYAAYGCPVPTSILDNLKKTEHMVVNNIVNVRTSSINELWKKVNMPLSDTRREKLPPRCNRRWFCRTFLGRDEVENDGTSPIMSHVEKLNMYDPLALLCCVPAYRESHFHLDTTIVNEVPQSVVGVSEQRTGIVDAEALCAELFSLFRLAFLRSLQNICKRRVAMQRSSIDF